MGLVPPPPPMMPPKPRTPRVGELPYIPLREPPPIEPDPTVWPSWLWVVVVAGLASLLWAIAR